MTGVSECSQQRSNLKDDGYKCAKYINSSSLSISKNCSGDVFVAYYGAEPMIQVTIFQ
nr:hypothetical protein [Photorhabdus sp. RW14-46]